MQAHRQRDRDRGFEEKMENEEEGVDSVGGGGLEGEGQRVVMGQVWGRTVWRRPGVGDGKGGEGGRFEEGGRGEKIGPFWK